MHPRLGSLLRSAKPQGCTERCCLVLQGRGRGHDNRNRRGGLQGLPPNRTAAVQLRDGGVTAGPSLHGADTGHSTAASRHLPRTGQTREPQPGHQHAAVPASSAEFADSKPWRSLGDPAQHGSPCAQGSSSTSRGGSCSGPWRSGEHVQAPLVRVAAPPSRSQLPTRRAPGNPLCPEDRHKHRSMLHHRPRGAAAAGGWH